MKITKNQLKRIIREEKQKLITETRVRKVVREALLNEEVHPYDKGLMQAMDVGYYSNGDAIDEIEGDLRRVKLARVDDTTITVSYGSNSRTVTFEGDTPEMAADKADAFEEDWEEMKYSMDGDYNDDAYDLLRYIPIEIKDLLPVQEFEYDDMDDDY